MPLLAVGDPIRFRIPYVTTDHHEAELPWGQIVGVINDHRVLVQVDNILASSDIHGFYFGDWLELELVWTDPKCPPIWQSVGLVKEAPSI